jgi:hypothetical protein
MPKGIYIRKNNKWRCNNCGQIKNKKGVHICPTRIWNEGTKGVMKAWNKGKPAPWAKNLPQKFKIGDKIRLGKKFSKEQIERLSKSHIGIQSGNKHPNWKGGKYGWNVRNAPRPRPDKCEACGSNGTICFDHDHITNKFRGWICMQCNFALGQVHDDKKILLDLIKYLEKHEN